MRYVTDKCQVIATAEGVVDIPVVHEIRRRAGQLSAARSSRRRDAIAFQLLTKHGERHSWRCCSPRDGLIGICSACGSTRNIRRQCTIACQTIAIVLKAITHDDRRDELAEISQDHFQWLHDLPGLHR